MIKDSLLFIIPEVRIFSLFRYCYRNSLLYLSDNISSEFFVLNGDLPSFPTLAQNHKVPL